MDKLFILPENSKLIVVGDIHGDLETLNKILEKSNFYDNNKILVCLGDYADRGLHGLEVYELLFDLLEKYTDRVILLKGNHESYAKLNEEIIPTFSPCNFLDELKEKYRDAWKEKIEEFYNFWDKLPLATILPNNYLFVHGGISSKIESLDDLKNPSKELEEEILWNDPFEQEGEQFNYSRGIGKFFGPNITENICKKLNVKMIIRSHQPGLQQVRKNGYAFHHNKKLLTISSTTIYGGKPVYLEISDKTLRINNLR
jgi:protein phosphatase